MFVEFTRSGELPPSSGLAMPIYDVVVNSESDPTVVRKGRMFMSSFASIGGSTASSYAVVQTPAVKPQAQVATQNAAPAKTSPGNDADGDGDRDGGGIDISG
jgi:hypothetical protein